MDIDAVKTAPQHRRGDDNYNTDVCDVCNNHSICYVSHIVESDKFIMMCVQCLNKIQHNQPYFYHLEFDEHNDVYAVVSPLK